MRTQLLLAGQYIALFAAGAGLLALFFAIEIERSAVPIERLRDKGSPIAAYAGWYEQEIAQAHEHDWAAWGCHYWGLSTVACTMTNSIWGPLFRLFRSVPEGDLRDRLMTKWLTAGPEERRALLNEFARSAVRPEEWPPSIGGDGQKPLALFLEDVERWLEATPSWH